jgi:mannitol 2-dehydrogenase
LTVAAWCRYLNGRDEQGCLIAIHDALADRLTHQTRLGGLDPRPLLRMSEIFGEDLPHSPRFVEAVTNALRKLYEFGSRATLASVSSDLAANQSDS